MSRRLPCTRRSAGARDRRRTRSRRCAASERRCGPSSGWPRRPSSSARSRTTTRRRIGRTSCTRRGCSPIATRRCVSARSGKGPLESEVETLHTALRSRRHRDPHRLPARRDTAHGRVRHLRAGVAVGGPPGRADGGECARAAHRRDTGRRDPAGVPRRHRRRARRARLGRCTRRRDRAASRTTANCAALLGAAAAVPVAAISTWPARSRGVEAVYREVGPDERRPRVPRPRPRTTCPRSSSCCTTSMGRSDDSRFDDLFRWKHLENTFGPSPMWVACAGGAHRRTAHVHALGVRPRRARRSVACVPSTPRPIPISRAGASSGA